MISNKSYAAQAHDLADQAVAGTTDAINATRRVANDTIDRVAGKVQDVRDQAAPVLSRVAERAETLARRGLDSVRDTSSQVRDRAVRASDATIGYVKDEPVKSMLIAAAVGAGLMALVSLVSRSRD